MSKRTTSNIVQLNPAPPSAALAADDGLTAHETVYRQLRERILFGGFRPGGPVTLRGLAETLNVSPMPVREAVRRLIAERALEMQDNRRVLVPPMSRSKFEQILVARTALEPELAARAMPNMTREDIDAVDSIDKTVDKTMVNGDVEGYMRANFMFHFTIYGKASCETLLALVESVWLQFGPFMRMAYGRTGTAKLEDHHVAAIAAMRLGDVKGLKAAIAADINQGMGFIGDAILNLEA